ncbi:DUF1707 SHOCT-like domain-containing protein [Cumulibacter soli]|uniref:DUF1707 SHOCT-like domain-containing protein n=1 Tax=Cumulibacter soli TaxID=2546344 RepID=UPI0014191FE5|nr:DUF1707 domain-containing protein [Cumulibacter soli]
MSGPTNPHARPDDQVRVGHLEREEVVALLGESMSGGYLNLDEFEQRVTRAQDATNRGELRALLGDLPAATKATFGGQVSPGAQVAAGSALVPGEAVSQPWTAPVETVLEGSASATVTRRGRWRVTPHLTLTGSMATFKLDFGEADVPPQGVEIDVHASWSTIRLYLSPAMQLVSDDFVTNMWTTIKDKAREPTERPLVPISVRGRPSWSTVVVRRSKL